MPASYDELLDIATTSGSTLLPRIKVAAQMMAGKIVTEPPTTTKHAERLAWARATFADPDAAGRALVWPVLYQAKGFTKEQIEQAADTLIQPYVDAAITALAV
jgi:hypothetical protein